MSSRSTQPRCRPGSSRTGSEPASRRCGASTVVIDSLNGYQAAMPEEQSLILHMHELLQFLNRQGATTFLTVAQHGLDRRDEGAGRRYLPRRYGPAAALLRGVRARAAGDLGHQEADRRRTRTRSASSGSAPSGITVGEPLTDFQGILRGVPAVCRAEYRRTRRPGVDHGGILVALRARAGAGADRT